MSTLRANVPETAKQRADRMQVTYVCLPTRGVVSVPYTPASVACPSVGI